MTQNELILMADASGISMFAMGLDRNEFLRRLEAFAKLVAQAEREACAKVAEPNFGIIGSTIALGIKARGEQA